MKDPKNDHKHDPFGRVPSHAAASVPLSLETREGRIIVAERIAARLVESSDPYEKWFGSANLAWLWKGKQGELEGKYLGVTGKQGSHSTPAQVLRRNKGS